METKIYQYLDYRAYLRAWATERRVSSKSFSLRQFARRAGISSPNYFQRVSEGSVKLNEAMIEKFVRGLGLSDRESEYFRALIRFNQSEDAASKVEHLRALERINKHSEIRVLQNKNLFKAWYYPVIWELVTCKDFVATPDNIVSALHGAIKKTEAKAALQFLVQNGYILATEMPHRYKQPDVRVTLPDEISHPFTQLTHRTFSEIAQQKIALPISEREFQGVTIAVSRERFELAKKMLKKFAAELADALAQDPEADRVVRINLQMFPLTQVPNTETALKNKLSK